MNIQKSLKKALTLKTVIIISILCSLILAIYAFTSWNRTVPWDITATTDIEVYSYPEMQLLPSGGSEPTVSTSSFTEDYFIKNLGNTAIDVSVTELWTNQDGGIAIWTGLPVTIPKGSNATVTLNLSNLPAGTGSYQYTFNSVQTP